jgi:cysteinyl-tRNA synthetase
MGTLRLYNTLSRRMEEFQPLNPPNVKIYSCGPTVYDYVHIGNFRTFIFQDLLRRYLKYKGYVVYQCCNITDVDDKTIRSSHTEQINLGDYTQRYEKAFFEDLHTLNIEQAELYSRATEHIDEMVSLIKRLLDIGYAYDCEGSVYYDISKFSEYGKLSHLSTSNLTRGARIKADKYNKEEAQDFALWKAWDLEDGDVYWNTELGKGRPGWHIECSAMSMKYLGETFDIHTGGVDLIFPHHENEIAQSEASTGKPFVRFWLHCEHLLVNGQKMSKSSGNYYTLKDLLKKGYGPLAIRYLLLSTNYKSPMNFTEEGLEQSKNTLERITQFINRTKHNQGFNNHNPQMTEQLAETRRRFQEAMDDNLNTPVAMAVIFELIRSVNNAIDEEKVSDQNLEEVYFLMMEFNEVLGIVKFEEIKLDSEIKLLIELREDARRRKDWKSADRLRNEILQKGVILEDTPQGIRWKRRW